MKLSQAIIISASLLLTFTQTLFADTCPTAIQIAAGQFNGWQVFTYSNSPAPASLKEIQTLETFPNLTFDLALWRQKLPPLPGICLYSDVAVLLAKATTEPVIGQGNWKSVNRFGQTIYTCAGTDVSQCPF